MTSESERERINPPIAAFNHFYRFYEFFVILVIYLLFLANYIFFYPIFARYITNIILYIRSRILITGLQTTMLQYEKFDTVKMKRI